MKILHLSYFRLVGIGLLVCLVWLLVPMGTVLARADILQASPGVRGHDSAIPESVIIEVSEAIDPGLSSITVYGPGGSAVNAGELEIITEPKFMVEVPITDAGTGVYVVRWNFVSSVDGSTTEGAYTFTIGDQNNFPMVTTMVTSIITLIFGILIGVGLGRRQRTADVHIQEEASSDREPAETTRS